MEPRKKKKKKLLLRRSIVDLTGEKGRKKERVALKVPFSRERSGPCINFLVFFLLFPCFPRSSFAF